MTTGSLILALPYECIITLLHQKNSFSFSWLLNRKEFLKWLK